MATDAVWADRLRRAASDRSDRAVVEPAAHRRLSAGDPVCRRHRRSGGRTRLVAPWSLWDPGGLRAAARNRRRQGGVSKMDLAATVAAIGKDPAFAALARSLEVYYGHPERDAAMDRLYARFLRPGDLAFDIGSHVGDRIGSFRRLGAKVVALEPQPLCAKAIRAIYGGDSGVVLLEAACAATPGRL